MKKGKKLYEGKAKILYAAPEKGTAIQHFKDHATAFNNQKKTIIEGKNAKKKLKAKEDARVVIAPSISPFQKKIATS